MSNRMVSTQPRISAGPEDEKEYFPAIETHLIASRYVPQTFKIQVMQPPRKKGQVARCPVVYGTDGNLMFDVIKGISYSMQTYERDALRFMVVGIGYPDDSPLAGSVLRARDLTFPGYPQLSTAPPPFEGVLLPGEGSKEFYGAEDFRQFIEHELIPSIETHYATITGQRTYFGHSAGGGFGLFTLFSRPELFSNYIISSPGLIYHGESSAGVHYDNHDFVLQDARAFIASGKSLPGVRLFMSVGSEEEFEPGVERWQLTSSFYRMAALLKRAQVQGLDLTTEVFPGETHMTAWPLAFIHGIRAMCWRSSAS